MTAENVFKWSRVYKLYYAGKYDMKRYKGGMKMPPLIKQPDRVYYHKLAGRLTDAQIHALFLVGYFFAPTAHISALSTPKAISAGVEFAARAENGRTVLEHGLYDLSKTLHDKNLDEWLYGEWIGDVRVSMPECVQSVISGEIPLDIAALLLLIPQSEFGYNWTEHFKHVEDSGLGIGPWIQRLKRMDMLLVGQRPGWRMLAHGLSKEFWKSLGLPLLPVSHQTANSLFS
jgi:hypothetical protein